MRRVLNMFAWATLWLRPLYGRVLNMFGMGRPMAAAALWGVCLICLAWAALWPRLPLSARASNIWHGQPCGSGSHEGPRVLKQNIEY